MYDNENCGGKVKGIVIKLKSLRFMPVANY